MSGMAHPVAHTFLIAAELNRQCERRDGNLLNIRPNERIIVTGDIHGHRTNLMKVIKHAALGTDPNRVLILQEILHGGPTDGKGGDRSFELLMRVARLKDQYPEQVHLLMANHDTAELTGNEITKDGYGTCESFRTGLANAFGADADEVGRAIHEFLLSLPLVAKCPNGILIAHSLPSPGRERFFAPDILHRPYREEDFHRGHPIYELVWGRRQDEASLAIMAQLFGSDLFITGHQPQDNGYLVNGRQLILASEHSHGAIAEFDADEEIELDMFDTIVRRISTLRGISPAWNMTCQKNKKPNLPRNGGVW